MDIDSRKNRGRIRVFRRQPRISRLASKYELERGRGNVFFCIRTPRKVLPRGAPRNLPPYAVRRTRVKTVSRLGKKYAINRRQRACKSDNLYALDNGVIIVDEIVDEETSMKIYRSFVLDYRLRPY